MLLMATTITSNPLQLSITHICLRMMCALLIGAVIGIEREYTHRPAGMRTHMLVALGSCVVMITGQQIFMQYLPYGASPDPARLSAQVITGVGFLGAGTIMREGVTVKGLTTAASIWAVACLGIASGAGYYAIALVGMICIFVTLTVFERFQRWLINSHIKSHECCIECRNITNGLNAVTSEAKAAHVIISDIHAKLLTDSNLYHISFKASFNSRNIAKRKQEFSDGLLDSEEITAVLIDGSYGDSTYHSSKNKAI